MKKFSQNFIALIMLLIPLSMVASTDVCSFLFSKVVSSETPDNIKDIPNRHKLPSSQIECVITSDGICVHDSSVDLAEAISYEIWDAESEWCVASFSDEFSFIESLFAMSGELQIRIVFSDYELVGNVCI